MNVFLKIKRLRPAVDSLSLGKSLARLIHRRRLLTFACCCAAVFVAGHANGSGGKNWRTLQQSFVVRGLVTDKAGSPLADASVRVLPSSREVKTDIEGKFLVEADSKQDSLIISFVGYITHVLVIGDQRDFIIQLEIDEEQQKLDEVVVVGFGTQKKTTMVGAVSSVSVG